MSCVQIRNFLLRDHPINDVHARGSWMDSSVGGLERTICQLSDISFKVLWAINEIIWKGLIYAKAKEVTRTISNKKHFICWSIFLIQCFTFRPNFRLISSRILQKFFLERSSHSTSNYRNKTVRDLRFILGNHGGENKLVENVRITNLLNVTKIQKNLCELSMFYLRVIETIFGASVWLKSYQKMTLHFKCILHKCILSYDFCFLEAKFSSIFYYPGKDRRVKLLLPKQISVRFCSTLNTPR